jgi:hypothetical protein
MLPALVVFPQRVRAGAERGANVLQVVAHDVPAVFGDEGIEGVARLHVDEVRPRAKDLERAQFAAVLMGHDVVRIVGTRAVVAALVVFRTSYFTYDRPKTTLDLGLQYYPSLSNIGRQRLQLDVGVKREFWKDLFVAVNLYNTFDNRPPNPAADTNDVGVVLSIGWTY